MRRNIEDFAWQSRRRKSYEGTQKCASRDLSPVTLGWTLFRPVVILSQVGALPPRAIKALSAAFAKPLDYLALFCLIWELRIAGAGCIIIKSIAEQEKGGKAFGEFMSKRKSLEEYDRRGNYECGMTSDE